MKVNIDIEQYDNGITLKWRDFDGGVDGQNIVAPDRDGIEKWQAKAREIGYDLLTVDTTPVTKWWQESDGPKADIADVVIRHINTHTHIRSIEEEPAVRELIEKLDLERVNE